MKIKIKFVITSSSTENTSRRSDALCIFGCHLVGGAAFSVGLFQKKKSEKLICSCENSFKKISTYARQLGHVQTAACGCFVGLE